MLLCAWRKNCPAGLFCAAALFVLVSYLRLHPPSHNASVMSAGIAYRAAVVEVNPSAYMGWDGSAKGALEIMLKNVATVDRWSAKAAAQAAQIIVFPEDMVSSYGGGGPNWRSKLTTPALFAEPLPPPGSPMCLEGDAGVAAASPWPVAAALACTAKRHKIVIVVGLGITAPCDRKVEPLTGQLLPCDMRTKMGQYDGAAAFGPDGTLLGQHLKAHIAYVSTQRGSHPAASRTLQLSPWFRCILPALLACFLRSLL